MYEYVSTIKPAKRANKPPWKRFELKTRPTNSTETGILGSAGANNPVSSVRQCRSLAQAIAAALARGESIANLNPQAIQWRDEGNVASLRLLQNGSGGGRGNAAKQAHYYTAPERTGLLHQAKSDQRAELYTAGAVMYHIVCGQPPFQGADVLQVLSAHITRPPRSPDDIAPNVPAALAQIIMALSAKAPESRYESADLLVQYLAKVEHAIATDVPLQAFEPALRQEHPGTPSGMEGSSKPYHCSLSTS